LAIATNPNITGTSTNTPTTVARAAPELKPKIEIAVATANSKKLLAPIIAAGAATGCSIFQALDHPYAITKMKKVCIVNGIAINRI
jgi:hypothetical protein